MTELTPKLRPGRPRTEIPGETAVAKIKANPPPTVALAADDIREVAREMALTALRALAQVCEFSLNDSARVAAARELLDRAGGKAHIFETNEVKPQSQIRVVFGEPVKTIDG